MNDKIPDWTQFTKRIYIDKHPSEVYKAWAVPENITEWFLEKADYTDGNGNKREPAVFIQPGDKHAWKWHNWDFTEEGEVIAANADTEIAFTFGSGGNVFVYLKESKGGTELELIQKDIPKDEAGKMNQYVGCSNGWTFWLTNLKAWLEHGITLHAKGLEQTDTENRVNS
ncbi:MAG: SRPBCC domain-containing protein [Candidatus Kapaibacterium sp.]